MRLGNCRGMVVMESVTKIQRKYQSISQPFGEDTQSIKKVVSGPQTDLSIPSEAISLTGLSG